MSVVYEDELIGIANAQDSRHARRYDPDSGLAVPLSCTASGIAGPASPRPTASRKKK